MLAAREMYIVSKAWGDRGGDFKRTMNGTGSYRLVSYEPHVRYVLERYAKAWNPPCIDRIEMTPINNDHARMDALKSGQVDFTEYVIWQETEYFFTHPGFRVYRGRDLFDFVRLNPNRPPLDRPQVRQALNFAINRQTINIVAFRGQGLPMEGFLTKPDSWAYNPETSKVWKYDPKRAVALLAGAGLKPQDLHLTFEADPGPETFDPAQVILTELRQLGVNVDFKIIDIPTLVKKRANGDYLLLMDGKSLPWNDPTRTSTSSILPGRITPPR
jgi:peptide/nickel transport system substrate-binding protein